jgi:hypothetical protein
MGASYRFHRPPPCFSAYASSITGMRDLGKGESPYGEFEVWNVEFGMWRVGSGEWGVESGEWRVERRQSWE